MAEQPRVVTIREYSTAPGVALSDEEETALVKVAHRALAITPSFVETGLRDLGSVVIELRPKIDTKQLLFLLTFSLSPKDWKSLEARFAPNPDLVEALLPGYIYQLNKAFANGILRGYRETEDALQGIRGRVRFEEQLRRRLNIAPPIEVRFDEYDQDIVENQLIRAALARLGRMRIRSDELRRGLRRLDSSLMEVSLKHFDPRSLPSISYTRLNEHYEVPVNLSGLILRSSSFDVRHGNVHSSSFLLNMNDIFEDFVVLALREALGLKEFEFPREARGKNLYLDLERQRGLKPDISWWHGARCVLVGDVKYKDLDSRSAPESDIYQLVTYLTATQLPAGILVYASRQPTVSRFHIAATGAVVEVHGLGIDRSQNEILDQIRHIGSRMKVLSEVELQVAS